METSPISCHKTIRHACRSLLPSGQFHPASAEPFSPTFPEQILPCRLTFIHRFSGNLPHSPSSSHPSPSSSEPSSGSFGAPKNRFCTSAEMRHAFLRNSWQCTGVPGSGDGNPSQISSLLLQNRKTSVFSSSMTVPSSQIRPIISNSFLRSAPRQPMNTGQPSSSFRQIMTCISAGSPKRQTGCSSQRLHITRRDGIHRPDALQKTRRPSEVLVYDPL
jgi:hypothetical protein